MLLGRQGSLEAFTRRTPDAGTCLLRTSVAEDRVAATFDRCLQSLKHAWAGVTIH